VVAITDMQGRLQGKRFDACHFLDHVAEDGAEACSYLLATDIDMRTVGGYSLTSWEKGYGDFVMKPDLSTLRPLPWHPGSVLCLADVEDHEGQPVLSSPRHMLRSQLARLEKLGLCALAGTELEFIVFDSTYEEAWRRAYRELKPAGRYNADYSVLGTSYVEPFLRRLRRQMTEAGMAVESVKGECNHGQFELAFAYDLALSKCDEHALFKLGAKEIAAQEGMALTFMSKVNEREGSSCHIHLSLRDGDGKPVFPGDGSKSVSPIFRHFLAGQMACLRPLCLFFAPTVNSYKRFVEGSFAPTAVAWGWDNRTCAFRAVGQADSLRIECRVPGGDVNPYLAVAALIAGGVYGIEHSLELEPPCTGNAYAAGGERVPTNLRDAAHLFQTGDLARDAFGEAVVEHYAHMAHVEAAAFESSVTDWELIRGFERL
jgi:glutamine synthetase